MARTWGQRGCLRSGLLVAVQASVSGSPPASKVAPIVVSAGLAVGVFFALVATVGVKRPSSGMEVAADASSASADAGTVDAASIDAPAPIDAPPDAAPAGDGDFAILRFVTIPPEATVTVDGKEVSEATTKVPLVGGKAVILLKVTADGYLDLKRDLTIRGDETLEIELGKRERGGGDRRNGSSSDRDQGGSKGNGSKSNGSKGSGSNQGGLIDL